MFAARKAPFFHAIIKHSDVLEDTSRRLYAAASHPRRDKGRTFVVIARPVSGWRLAGSVL